LAVTSEIGGRAASTATPAGRRGGGRALGGFFVALGAFGLPIGIWLSARALGGGLLAATPSFVFGNVQRLPHDVAVASAATAYPLNVGITLFWTTVVVLFAVHSAGLLRSLFRDAPQSALVAGAFLAGATIFGVVAGISILKVSEFAVQSMLAAPAEQVWLRDGITFMNQLHLFYVHAWFVCMAAGWVALGLTPRMRSRRVMRNSSLVLAAGLAVATAVLARMALPAFGPQAPAILVVLSDSFFFVAVAAGWIGSGLLARALADEER
jgi:hypothetical protein